MREDKRSRETREKLHSILMYHNGGTLSIREIMKISGYSKSTVLLHLKALEESGVIKREIVRHKGCFAYKYWVKNDFKW